jgi:hypothetical protein
MPRVTIEVTDQVHDWLETEARTRRASVDELINACIDERRGGVVLTPQETYILGLFHNVSTKAGWLVPIRMLWTNWGVRGTVAELNMALEGLVRKDLVTPNSDKSGYTLTEAGFGLRQH